MNNRRGDRWSGWDRGSRIPGNVSQSPFMRSSGQGNLALQPDSGLVDWQRHSRVPFSSFRLSSDATPGALNGRRQFEESLVERGSSSTSSNTRFPSELDPTMQLLLFDSITRETQPRPDPFPRFSGLLHRNALNIQPRQDPSKPINENSLKMLKKVTYGSDPKTLTRKLSLFYNGVSGSTNATWKKNSLEESHDDSKRCTICLDDFEIGNQVMVTRCDHMFHEDCILPWIKSNWQCPVCRSVIAERVKADRGANSVSPLYDESLSSWDVFLSSF